MGLPSPGLLHLQVVQRQADTGVGCTQRGRLQVGACPTGAGPGARAPAWPHGRQQSLTKGLHRRGLGGPADGGKKGLGGLPVSW
jgi:hypothetical protein